MDTTQAVMDALLEGTLCPACSPLERAAMAVALATMHGAELEGQGDLFLAYLSDWAQQARQRLNAPLN